MRFMFNVDLDADCGSNRTEQSVSVLSVLSTKSVKVLSLERGSVVGKGVCLPWSREFV